MMRGKRVAALIAALVIVMSAVLIHLMQTQHKRQSTKSHAWSWRECYTLDAWYLNRVAVAPDGSRRSAVVPDREWRFGWFCYQTLIDPGPMLWIHPGGPVAPPVSDELHGHFRRLAAACESSSLFGGGLRSLFENADTFGRSVPFFGIDMDRVGPLSEEQRLALLTIAQTMRRVVRDTSADEKTRGAAHLVVALTSGKESPKDTVNADELARIPALYPKERLTSFLSQYYLGCILAARGEEPKASEVAREAVRQYRGYAPLRDLAAYQHFREILEEGG